MKKILLVMLAIIMVVTALTSCNIVSNMSKNKENTPPETRYTITEEEWNAFFNMKNYTLEIDDTIYTTNDGISHIELQLHHFEMQSEYAQYIKDYVGHDYYYVVKNGNSYYVEIGYNGEVEWAETDRERDSAFMGYDPMCEFSDLTYDESKKAYCFATNEESESETYELYFENGKIVKMTHTYIYEITDDYGNVETKTDNKTFIFSNIGTTVVEVPEFAVE